MKRHVEPVTPETWGTKFVDPKVPERYEKGLVSPESEKKIREKYPDAVREGVAERKAAKEKAVANYKTNLAKAFGLRPEEIKLADPYAEKYDKGSRKYETYATKNVLSGLERLISRWKSRHADMIEHFKGFHGKVVKEPALYAGRWFTGIKAALGG